MNSLNVSVIFSPLKFTEFIAGTLRSKTGAMVSFGPPDGDTIFAHLGKMLIINKIMKIETNNFFNEMLFNMFSQTAKL